MTDKLADAWKKFEGACREFHEGRVELRKRMELAFEEYVKLRDQK
jgi:hypothetical protein